MQRNGSFYLFYPCGAVIPTIGLLGIDTTSGRAPSMFQVSKLFLNAEVREAAKNLVEEFKKAGVDVNAKVNTFMMQLLWLTWRGPNVLIIVFIQEIMEEMAIFSKMGGGPKS